MIEYADLKTWRKANPEKVRAQGHRRYARRKDRLKTQRDAELVAKAGRPRPDTCELCGEAPVGVARGTRVKTVWDHDHITGEFRGWLCDRCNRVLGQVKDSTELLQKMIDYLNGARRGKTDVQAA